jgi:CIC family chloride channel protein
VLSSGEHESVNPPTQAGQLHSEQVGDALPGRHSLYPLALLSLLVGVVVGAVGALFRLSLTQADGWRDALIYRAYGSHLAGLLLVTAACAAATGLAAWLVRRYSPHASGSGIPHVEAVLDEKLPPAPPTLIPIKFAGGWLAIGSGQALGREGPTVQMGASIAHLLGETFRRSWPDCQALLAAGAGAGLATAFNAPIAGAVFVLEELVRRFDTRITIATFGASVGAIAVGRVLLGNVPDFYVEPLPYAGFGTVPLHLVLGVLAGVLGVAYNRAILGALAVGGRLGRLPVEYRAALIGAVVGLVGWFGPSVIGGGDAITQHTLSGTEALPMLSLLLLSRFALGALSYAAGAPGGLFAPMLVLGAQSGVLFGTVLSLWFPDLASSTTALGIVGMAAFFTGVVRAPVTGIVLVTEMTASFTLLLPMLGACFAALVVADGLGSKPIYESLLERELGL